MTVEFKDFKEIVKGKTISFIGKIKTKFSASQIHNFLDKVRSKKEKRLLKKIEKCKKEIEAQEDLLKHGTITKEGAEAANAIKYRNEFDLATTRKMLDDLYKTKELEYETRNKLRDYFPQLEVEELPKLESYYDVTADRFYICGKEFNPNVYEDKIAIINNFKDYEYSSPGRWARAMQNYGAETVGEDFIRLFSAGNDKEQFVSALQNAYLEIEEKIGSKEMSKLNKKPANKIREELSNLNFPNLRHMIEPVKKETIDPETVEISKPAIETQVEQAEKQIIDPDMVDAIKPVVEIEPEIVIEPEPEPMPEKDKYTIAIEQAQEKQDKIRSEIEQTYKERSSKINTMAESAEAFGFDRYNVDVNVSDFDEKIANLELELKKAKEEEKNAFDERRQKNIDEMKKANEERLQSLNKKAAEEVKAKAAQDRLMEAKQVLSNIETSTGYFDISNYTDEEILEEYDRVSKGMPERVAKAREKMATNPVPLKATEESNMMNNVTPAEEIENIQKDKYTIAIEQAQEKQDKIKSEIEQIYKERSSKINTMAESAETFGFDRYNVDVNVSDFDEKIANLELELKKAKEEEKNAFDERRQKNIDEMKKANEERLQSLNKKAAEEVKAKAAQDRLMEAKEVLSNIATSTGYFNIENLTDEEVLEEYDRASKGMPERVDKAKKIVAVMNSEGYTEDQARALVNSNNPEAQEMVQNCVDEYVQSQQIETGKKTR